MGIFEYLEKRREQTGKGRTTFAKAARIPQRTFYRWLASGEMPLSAITQILNASKRNPVKARLKVEWITAEELVQDLDRVRRGRKKHAAA